MNNKEKLFLVKYAQYGSALPGNPIPQQQVHNAAPNIMSSGTLPGKPIVENYAPHDPFQPGGAKIRTSYSPLPVEPPPLPQAPAPQAPAAPGASTGVPSSPAASSGPMPGTPAFYKQRQDQKDSMLTQDQINKRIKKFPNGRLARQQRAKKPVPNAPQTGNTPDVKMPYYTGAWSG